jgi:hypothetical protein
MFLDRERARENFLASIDRGLDAFGSNVRLVVYFELNRLFGISREEIPLKPDRLVETIDELFGVGAFAVSRAILKELEASSGIKGLSQQNLLTALREAYHEQLARQS